MKFHSIRTRLMTATALLIVATVSAVVWLWTDSERTLLRRHKQDEAAAYARALAIAFMNELDDENWSQVRIAAELLAERDTTVLYVMVTDDDRKDLIIAAAPPELADQYMPDVVRTDVTLAALEHDKDKERRTRVAESWLLRDVDIGKQRRGTRGERIVEVATDIHIASGDVVGTIRVGISLAEVDRAVAAAVTKTLGIGALALLVGLIGAFMIARRMTQPVLLLQESAAQIAVGDLTHRASVGRTDEIGALARAFNDMAIALQGSFARLRKTLDSFERFVPRKFLAVIAPTGIENIQVGVGTGRRLSVLFSDIRGYTSLSEGLTPLEVFNFLNDYLARMGLAISEHGGFVDKYIGDAVMALFDDEATDRVLDAALAMRRSLATLNRERVARGLKPIDAGIGIHGGDVVMGTIGFTSKIESTVVGDAVNTASRLEALTKEHKVAILVSEDVVSRVKHPGAYQLRLVDGALAIRGREGTLAVYELADDGNPRQA